jgi:hypothetical protein
MTQAKPEVAIPMTREQFYDWLMSRIRDGGSIALRELSDFARDERELLLKGPAMAAMFCWKE